MRVFLISLTLLFVAATAAAQDQSDGQASAPEGSPAFQKSWPNFTRDLSTLRLDPQVFYRTFRLDPRIVEEARAKNAPCYTMRSYLFDRRDGFAPDLVGMTTCTSARDFQLKRTKRPAGGFVPLIWSGGNTQR